MDAIHGIRRIEILEYNTANWMEKVRETYLFIEDDSRQEETIRAYFLNHFIDAIKDEGTHFSTECDTWRGRTRTGRADYFFRFLGEWIPFEAKVAVNAERDVRAQAKQYIDIDRFDYRVIEEDGFARSKRNSRSAGNHRICLIGDQYGIYLTVNGEFVECSADRPRWSRTKMGEAVLANVRETLRSLLDRRSA